MFSLKLMMWVAIIVTVIVYVAIMLPAALDEQMLPEDGYTPDAEKRIRTDSILAGIAVAGIGGLAVIFLMIRMMDR